MAFSTKVHGWENDGTTLKSSGAVTSSGTAETAVNVGKADFDVEVVVSAATTGTGNDMFLIVVEENTLAATTTWTECGNLCLGDAGGTGRSAAITTGSFPVGVARSGDNQVRIKTYLVGSAASVTFSATAYPRTRMHASV
jgi:hypothetical protein